MRAALTFALLLLGCGPPSVSAGEHPAERPTSRTGGEEAPRAPRQSGLPYADTPIAPVAQELTDLALAAIEGRDLPATRVPMPEPSGPAQVVWYTDTRPRHLTILVIAFEVELVLKHGEPEEDAEGPARWGSVRATFALSRNGLRLVSLRPRTMTRQQRGGPLPAGMEGFAEVCAELLAALRRGDVSGYALDDADRALLGNDDVWARVQQDRVSSALAAQIQTMLGTLPREPLAYRFDDIALLAADEQDNLLSFAFQMEAQAGSYALRTEPLLEARRLWPL
jgi:hypothetical protein